MATHVNLEEAVGGYAAPQLGLYEVDDLPTADADNKGCIAVVTNSGHANGATQLVFSNGSKWVYAIDGTTEAST